MTKTKIDVSIVIINFNTANITIDCLNDVIRKTKDINYEIILIDNSSKVSDVEILSKFASKHNIIKFIKNKTNLGFSEGNNQGISQALGRYVLLLNSDTRLNTNVIGKMVNWMDKHPKAAISSCQLLNRDGSIQGTGGAFPRLDKVALWMLMLDDVPGVDLLIKPFHPAHKQSFYKGAFPKQPTQTDWVTGAYLLIRTDVAKQVSGFDKDYFMYTEEVDLCYRVKKLGWQVWLLPSYEIVHLGGASSSSEFPLLSEFKNLKLFYKKHYPLWQLSLIKILFKTGILIRVIIFRILKGPKESDIYVKAYKQIS